MSTGIEWTQRPGTTGETWNPVVGCTPVSPGCLNCYAATMARRLEAMGRPEYAPREVPGDARGVMQIQREDGLGYAAACRKREPRTVRIAEVRGGRAVFTGDVRTPPDRLDTPLHWKKPRTVFVNSMSDLYHEDVPFGFIDKVEAVMALTPQHTYQILTKRPERMAEHVHLPWPCDRLIALLDWASRESPGIKVPDGFGLVRDGKLFVPNAWLGTSVEDRARLERIRHLAKCPASVLFVSFEPLLEDLGDIRPYLQMLIDAQGGDPKRVWGIVGGESGANARPMHPDWPESLLKQHNELGVPFFFKQWGEWSPRGVIDADVDRAIKSLRHGKSCSTKVMFVGKSWGTGPLRMYDGHGSVTIKDHTGEVMVRRGKKASGHSLPWMCGSKREWPLDA